MTCNIQAFAFPGVIDMRPETACLDIEASTGLQALNSWLVQRAICIKPLKAAVEESSLCTVPRCSTVTSLNKGYIFTT